MHLPRGPCLKLALEILEKAPKSLREDILMILLEFYFCLASEIPKDYTDVPLASN